MANLCSNYMTVTGKGVEKLHKRIMKQDKTLFDIFTGFEVSSHYGLDSLKHISVTKTTMSLTYTSKWSPPEKDLGNLSEAYPNLEIENRYEEPGNGCFGILKFFGGDTISDECLDTFEYMKQYGPEDFIDTLILIEEGDYKDFIKQFKDYDPDGEEFTWSPYDLLEIPIAKRLKPKDIARFVGLNWSNEAREILSKKLASM